MAKKIKSAHKLKDNIKKHWEGTHGIYKKVMSS